MASIAVAKNSLSHMVNNLIIVLCIVIPNWRSIYREIGSSAMQRHDLILGNLLGGIDKKTLRRERNSICLLFLTFPACF